MNANWKKYIEMILIVCGLAFSFGANANTYSTNFSAADTGGDGGYYYFDEHQAVQTFMDTGLTSVDQLQLTLNTDLANAFPALGFSFYLNDIFIGETFFVEDFDVVKVLDFSFNSIVSPLDQWTLLMDVSYVVCIGCGGVGFTDFNPLTFIDNSVSTVPVPAAAWLFGSALLGFFGFTRRKANA